MDHDHRHKRIVSMSESSGAADPKIAALPLDLIGPVGSRADAFGDVLPVSSLERRALLLHTVTLTGFRLPGSTGALLSEPDRLWLSVAVGDDDMALGRVPRRALRFTYSADSLLRSGDGLLSTTVTAIDFLGFPFLP